MSVTDDPETKISALREGADDYVTKPFSLEELGARLDAVTRRAPQINSSVLSVGGIRLDQDSNAVSRGERDIHLTRKEYQMLRYFMKNTGTIISRAQLLEHIWTADGNPFSNTIEAHIRNLRRKLCEGDEPDLIMNLPGRGYIFDTLKSLKKL
jgi:two-component system OmpR family response regulator